MVVGVGVGVAPKGSGRVELCLDERLETIRTDPV